MKRFLLLAFILLASGSSAFGQCTGIFGPGTVCSTPGTASALPSQTRNPILGAVGVATGSLGLRGTTSGVVTIQPQAAAGTFNFNLPTTAGSAGQPLLSGGGGATGMSFDTLQIAAGGTGATTASDARTALGLGTIALQNANNVNITGGTITGLPNPSAGSDAANKAYVDAAATGIIVHTPVRLATAAVLPNTPTYANGASGVGATLTAGTNTTLTVDGSVAALNDRVLVKDQAAPAQNGVYSVTTAGSGGAPWVLTRVTDFDTTGEMVVGAYFLTTAGAANINSSFVLQATVPVVGTNAVTFVLFSTSPNAVTSVNIIGGSSVGIAGACNSTTSISCTLSVSLGGSTGNVQYNNGGVLGGLTDTQLASRVTPLNNTWTGTNIFTSNVYMGGGSPWIDVKSGANGCPAAVGNGVTADQSALQCQLNYIHNTLTCGVLYMPLGVYLIQSGLTVYECTTIQGVGMGANSTFSTLIQTSGDFTALSLVGGSNAYNGLRDLYIQCSQSTSATTSCVFVYDNTPSILSNIRILGGYRALVTHGVDGRYYNVFATAAATTSSSANLFSRGANFYYGCKFDSSSGQDFGALIALPYASSSTPMENQFHGCDFSNSTAFASAAFAVDDGGNPGGRVALTKCFDCIFGASLVASVIVNNSLATLIVGSEVAAIQFNGPSALGLSIYGSVAPGGGVVVSGAGAPRSCANLNITC